MRISKSEDFMPVVNLQQEYLNTGLKDTIKGHSLYYSIGFALEEFSC
jgi:hypothetical protein